MTFSSRIAFRQAALELALAALMSGCAEVDLRGLGSERVILDVHSTSRDEMPVPVVDSQGELLGELHFEANAVGKSDLMFRRPRGGKAIVCKAEESPRTDVLLVTLSEAEDKLAVYSILYDTLSAKRRVDILDIRTMDVESSTMGEEQFTEHTGKLYESLE